MPEGGAIQKEKVNIVEEEYKGQKRFLEALAAIEQAEDGLLFSPGPDFRLACPCDDCLPKIIKLEEFEEEIKAINKLILDYMGKLGYDEELCMTLLSTAEWTIDFLNFLLRQLEALYKIEPPLKKDPTVAKFHDVYQRFIQMMSENGMVDGSPDPSDYNKGDYVTSIAFEIGAGIFYYKQTRSSNEACYLLPRIAEIENVHEQQKKASELEGKMLDPSISIKYIENQIELVKHLPMEKLYSEAVYLIPKVCPRDKIRPMVCEAIHYVAKISGAMVKERVRFWRQFQEHPSSEDAASKSMGKRHNLNGLNEKLESLVTMVDEFKSHWERRYDPFFTRFDRSDPKRQRKVNS